MTFDSRAQRKRTNANNCRTYVVFASLIAALAITSLGRPDITNVEVLLPAKPSQQRSYVGLPYSHASDADSATFRVKADIWYSAVSTGRILITPDDCLEAITINGVDVPQVKSSATSWWRCWPNTYTIDLSQYLHLGTNVAMLKLTNKGGIYGINMVGLYSQAAVLTMVACAGLALYAAALALLEAVPKLLVVFLRRIGRMCVISFLPCLGLFAMWATVANSQEDWLRGDHIVTTLAAAIVPFALLLLLRSFDEPGGRPPRLSRSYPAAAVSLVTVAYASILLVYRGGSSPEIQGIGVLGVVAGFFACVPVRAFLKHLLHYPRAVAVAMVAALSPHAYWHLNLPLWGQMSDVTGAMVRGILWMCGNPTRAWPGERRGEDGKITDYYVYVSSSNFSVQIGSWCSGFEGVFLFLFLLSLFVLLDWNLFSKVRHLWAVYVLTVLFVLVVNAMRIAGLFLYAEWYIRQYNRKAAFWATTEAFHSNIGWVIYSVAFAVFLPLVYRWAIRAAKVN